MAFAPLESKATRPPPPPRPGLDGPCECLSSIHGVEDPTSWGLHQVNNPQTLGCTQRPPSRGRLDQCSRHTDLQSPLAQEARESQDAGSGDHTSRGLRFLWVCMGEGGSSCRVRGLTCRLPQRGVCKPQGQAEASTDLALTFPLTCKDVCMSTYKHTYNVFLFIFHPYALKRLWVDFLPPASVEPYVLRPYRQQHSKTPCPWGLAGLCGQVTLGFLLSGVTT